ncbi:MAG: 3-isopropylmalate dehydrogenase [Nitrospinota bacterium]|nr:3-isopropylmalate dehydrogenase [Nitrospinota bacterium]MDP7167761.1 3-isopropylmalate dehydrogenase [Nitrospinota bacterium]MDP7369557.1 3-isopropylmalate dehydrogenase [Nitrospinota bacterium]MDP7503301.1 3-isopropylmalate dehydrogenase [Nitrospinota bacterium]MDP7663099.1 3-isopropylmalate dehydrogenase [Nitrospinota bacterium]
MADYKIGVIPGDGIGQEVTAHARKVLDVAGVRFGVSFEFREGVAGGTAYDAAGEPFPSETQELCADSDACLFGAVGGPQWDALPREKRPEAAILGLRQKFGLFANLRPAAMFEPLVDASTLKAEAVRGLDLLVVREGVGGIYFGEPRITEQVNPDEERAVDTMVYSTSEIRRIVRVGFEMASVRRKKLLSVDKENVLETSRLWRRVAGEVARDFPDIEVSHMYVDNAAMQLIRDPLQFDVIVTGNMFGDILSDAASMLTGSIGMLASANLNEAGFGVFEPVHGTAPDIAGQDKANPIAAIMSAAMLCRYALKRADMADAIEAAVSKALDGGLRTPDIHTNGTTLVGCAAMGERVAELVGG